MKSKGMGERGKAVALCVLATMMVGTAAADYKTKAVVTVYSNGTVVETYEAIDEGRMDGDCYVFHVHRGVDEPEVRVCGTFSVEQVD